MTVITVTDDRTLTLPKSCSAFLKKGKSFLLFQTDDEVILKRIDNPDIRRRASLPSKRPPVSLEEITDLVNDVRRKNLKKR